MNLVLLLLKESWLTIIIAILTGLGSGVLSALLIVLLNSSVNGNFTHNLIGQFGILLILVALLATTSQFLLINLAQNTVYKLRLYLSEKILSAPLQELENLGFHQIMTSLTEDIQAISDGAFCIPFICIDTAILVSCSVYLFWVSKNIFLILALLTILGICIIQILLKKAAKYLKLTREEYDRLYKHFRTIIDGIKELKLHDLRRQEFLSKDFQSTAIKLKKLKSKSSRRFALSFGGGQILLFMIIGMIIFVLPQLIYIQQSILVNYMVTMLYAVLPIQNILSRLPLLINANVSLNKIERMKLQINDSLENFNSEYVKSYDQIKFTYKKIELKNILHEYKIGKENNRFILGELNLVFYPSQLVFVVGGNGSGKSTLVKLLTGLYVPSQGEVLLNNIIITDQNRGWYRQHFSVVFSDFYLFDSLLGIEDSQINEQLHEYMMQLQLVDKLQIENGIFSTTSLSQGQRKRIALLTAYLEDRPIYIFDEWASDQDPFFREIFYCKILPDLKSKGKTVIVITHDDRYYYIADRIIKLNYGKIED